MNSCAPAIAKTVRSGGVHGRIACSPVRRATDRKVLQEGAAVVSPTADLMWPDTVLNVQAHKTAA